MTCVPGGIQTVPERSYVYFPDVDLASESGNCVVGFNWRVWCSFMGAISCRSSGCKGWHPFRSCWDVNIYLSNGSCQERSLRVPLDPWLYKMPGLSMIGQMLSLIVPRCSAIPAASKEFRFGGQRSWQKLMWADDSYKWKRINCTRLSLPVLMFDPTITALCNCKLARDIKWHADSSTCVNLLLLQLLHLLRWILCFSF